MSPPTRLSVTGVLALRRSLDAVDVIKGAGQGTPAVVISDPLATHAFSVDKWSRELSISRALDSGIASEPGLCAAEPGVSYAPASPGQPALAYMTSPRALGRLLAVVPSLPYTLMWNVSVPVGNNALLAPVADPLDGSGVYAGTDGGAVHFVRAADGSVDWSWRPSDEGRWRAVWRPALVPRANGTLLLSSVMQLNASDDGRGPCVIGRAVRALSLRTRRALWVHRLASGPASATCRAEGWRLLPAHAVAGPVDRAGRARVHVLEGPHVPRPGLAGNATVTTLDAETGAVVWSAVLPGVTLCTTPVASFTGRLYVVCARSAGQAQPVVLALTPDGHVLWELELRAPVRASECYVLGCSLVLPMQQPLLSPSGMLHVVVGVAELSGGCWSHALARVETLPTLAVGGAAVRAPRQLDSLLLEGPCTREWMHAHNGSRPLVLAVGASLVAAAGETAWLIQPWDACAEVRCVHGVCVNGSCFCEANFLGPDCSREYAPLQAEWPLWIGLGATLSLLLGVFACVVGVYRAVLWIKFRLSIQTARLALARQGYTIGEGDDDHSAALLAGGIDGRLGFAYEGVHSEGIRVTGPSQVLDSFEAGEQPVVVDMRRSASQ